MARNNMGPVLGGGLGSPRRAKRTGLIWPALLAVLIGLLVWFYIRGGEQELRPIEQSVDLSATAE